MLSRYERYRLHQPHGESLTIHVLEAMFISVAGERLSAQGLIVSCAARRAVVSGEYKRLLFHVDPRAASTFWIWLSCQGYHESLHRRLLFFQIQCSGRLVLSAYVE